MSIKKILSGGQTGADRAALDFAMEYGIEHAGWVPEGRKAEDGVIPMQYNVNELPGGNYADRTAKNVIDADGTLIVSHGELTGGSLLTLGVAEKHGRPVLHIDMNRMIAFDAAIDIHEWIEARGVEVLNVAGPRESKDPNIYAVVRNLLETVFHIDIIANSMPGERSLRSSPGSGYAGINGGLPQTVGQAVDHLMADLSHMDKMRIASAEKERLGDFVGLAAARLGLESGNQPLIDDCRRAAGIGAAEMDGNEASKVILQVFWEKLRQSGHLRVIK